MSKASLLRGGVVGGAFIGVWGEAGPWTALALLGLFVYTLIRTEN